MCALCKPERFNNSTSEMVLDLLKSIYLIIWQIKGRHKISHCNVDELHRRPTDILNCRCSLCMCFGRLSAVSIQLLVVRLMSLRYGIITGIQLRRRPEQQRQIRPCKSAVRCQRWYRCHHSLGRASRTCLRIIGLIEATGHQTSGLH